MLESPDVQLGDVPRPCRLAAQSPPRPACLGRSVELQQLTNLLAAAEQGATRLAVIRGPAGIGKTHLAQEFGALALSRGATWATGTCWHDGTAPALWPWREILHELQAPAALYEEHGALRDRFAHFLAVLEHLRHTSARTTTLAVVDDAHLADPASLLLGRFLAQARGLRLLLIFSVCDDDAPPRPETRELLADLTRRAVVLTLEGLAPDAVGAFLATAGAAPVEPGMIAALAALTRGNPLHLRNIMLEDECLAGWPHGGLERAVARRLGLLSDDDRRCLGLGALLGVQLAAHELARIGSRSPVEVAECLTRARDAGLVLSSVDGRWAFVHERVRQVALDALPLAARLDGHANAVALVSGRDPAQLARRAHHALAAASRSRDDARLAVQAAREAARALRAAAGFESAAVLLERAVALHAQAALDAPLATLAVEHAEAVLACGRLAAARPLFQRAADVAEQEHDLHGQARAALGLGGLWVGEHRPAADAERVLARQRRALRALPPEANVLRVRLTVRLAAEDVYRGGPVEPVLAGLTLARTSGDAHALAEALSLAHHALLTPEHTWSRLSLATELIAAAVEAGDGLLALLGSCWRTTDLFQLGDPSAGAALDDLRWRADALGCLGLLFIAHAMEVMRAIRAGEFARAEQAAAACATLGCEAGDADALPYQAAQLAAIRYFQGREAELVDCVTATAASPALIEDRERSFAAAAALFALRAGQPGPAQALLARLHTAGLAWLPASSSWMTTLLAVVEIAAALDDAQVAGLAYEALMPYADLPLMASLAVVCFGSVQRCLGLAAQTRGQLAQAIQHFEAAWLANERLGHRPAAIQVQAELALARLRLGPAPRAAPARTLLDQALVQAQALGMHGLAARWRAVADALAPKPTACEAARAERVRGGCWRVEQGGTAVVVADRVGLRYLARLLAAPDCDIPALALVADGAQVRVEQGHDPLMDRKALAALRQRVRCLRERATPSTAEQDELSALTRELARALGLGGRVRSFADTPERARTAVRKAIKRAIDDIESASPRLGRHLVRRVETGTRCRYRLAGLPDDTDVE